MGKNRFIPIHDDLPPDADRALPLDEDLAAAGIPVGARLLFVTDTPGMEQFVGGTVDASSFVGGGLSNAIIKQATAGSALTVATAGQTVFALPGLPSDASSVVVEVNGQRYHPPFDFTVSGFTVTWTGAFALAPSDVVFVSYV